MDKTIINCLASGIRPGIKGASRAAVRRWIVEQGQKDTGSSLNKAINRALKKLLEQGIVVPGESIHRFKLDRSKLPKPAKKKKKKRPVSKKKKRKASKSKKRKRSSSKSKSKRKAKKSTKKRKPSKSKKVKKSKTKKSKKRTIKK